MFQLVVPEAFGTRLSMRQDRFDSRRFGFREDGHNLLGGINRELVE